MDWDKLSPQQRSMVEALMLNKGRIMSYAEVAKIIYPAGPPVSDNHAVHDVLRRLKDRHPEVRNLIKTVPRKGVTIEAD